MKYFYLTALLLLTSFHFAIAQRRDESTPRPKPAEVAKVAIAGPDSILLEISVERFAMGRAWKDPLYFRLYESGRLEYEVRQKIDPGAGNAREVFVKKEIQLSAPAVEGLKRLAEQPDFQNAREQYNSIVWAVDSSVVTTISYSHRNRNKKIVIRNYSPRHPKAESFYPKSLVKLLERASELRPKDQ